jgi:hypothetical protein
MNFLLNNGLWLLMLLITIVLLVTGIKAIKIEEKKQAGTMLLLNAICAFILCLLVILERVLTLTPFASNIVSRIELTVAGVWLGFYIVMFVLGHFRILRKRCNLTAYLAKQLPEGMPYNDAAQLCRRLYCTVDGVPDEFLPLSRQKLADIFAELAAIGWIRDLDSPLRSFYGAEFHEVTDRGHWNEVMASISKKGSDIHDLERGAKLACRVGFNTKQKP